MSLAFVAGTGLAAWVSEKVAILLY